MPTITLDDLAARINEKYEPTIVPLPDGRVVELTQPMRLSKEQRAELRRVVKENNDAAKKAEHAQKMRDQANEQREKDDQPRVELTEDEQEALNDAAEARTLKYLRSIVLVSAPNRGAAQDLLEMIQQGPDEMLMLTELVASYMKASQVGEASPSPS